MLQGIRALVWDLNDTLVNTRRARRIVQRTILAQLGFDDEDIKRGIKVWERLFWYFDTTDYHSVLPIVVTECGKGRVIPDEHVSEIVSKLNIEREVLNNLAPFNGVHELLTECANTGIPMGVVSNGDREFQMLKLAVTGLLTYFTVPDAIVICESHRCKPHPDPLLACCAALNVPPNSAAYVGDRMTDVITSALAGCRSIRISHRAPEAREYLGRPRLGIEQPFLTARNIHELRNALFRQSESM